MPKVTLGLVQMASAGSREANLKKVLFKIREAATRGAQVICLQELFSSDYFCQSCDTEAFKLAESVPGPTTQIFSKVAKEKKVVLVIPLFEKRAQGIYHNTAAVIDADGRYLGKYRKMHIPEDPNFHEKFYFTPGDLGFQVFKTKYARIGVLICWDQWFPEAARLTALQGAQILFYPTAIGFSEADRSLALHQSQGWEVVQRGHAVANEVFVAAVNRVGIEKNITFWGNSFVADPFGAVLAKASSNQEQTLIVKCDLSQMDDIRHGWPFLRDRRIDAYGEITQRFLQSGSERQGIRGKR